MGFQILDSKGEAITIAELDKEAATFWGKEVHSKNYAYPEIKPDKFENRKAEFNFYRYLTNWYDKIGYQIHSGMSLEEVREYIFEPFKGFSLEEILEHKSIGGYIKLIDFWIAKGYKGVSIPD